MDTQTTTLHVSGEDIETDVPLDPAGVIIGRSPDCHVVLDNPRISRRHARVFQDPFGRWIAQDLDSHNGVWIGDDRVQAQALLPGEMFTIRPYELSLVAPPTTQIEADVSIS